MADAILQSRQAARESELQPLAVVAAPHLSSEIVQELGEYVRDVGEGIAWGVLDGRGRLELHGPGLDSVRLPEGAWISDAPRREAPTYNPFSDLGQWMLKVLLAPHVSESWLRAPRSLVRGMAELAEHAGSSPASASRFLSELEADGYVEKRDGHLRLVRIPALLNAWRMAAQRPGEVRRARFHLPAADPLERIGRRLAERNPRREGLERLSAPETIDRKGRRACLAMFAACRVLGLGHVRGAPIHVYVEDLSAEVLEELELGLADRQSVADLVLIRPRFPESVFRGSVDVEGVPVADVLQCWVDVSFKAARGEEQAKLIEQQLDFMRGI